MFSQAAPEKIAQVMPRRKLHFSDPLIARRALAEDSLSCVYRRADRVFVMTAFGSGEFSSQEWNMTEPR